MFCLEGRRTTTVLPPRTVDHSLVGISACLPRPGQTRETSVTRQQHLRWRSVHRGMKVRRLLTAAVALGLALSACAPSRSASTSATAAPSSATIDEGMVAAQAAPATAQIQTLSFESASLGRAM